VVIKENSNLTFRL